MCGLTVTDSSGGEGFEWKGEKMTNSILSMLGLRKQVEKREDIAARHS